MSSYIVVITAKTNFEQIGLSNFDKKKNIKHYNHTVYDKKKNLRTIRNWALGVSIKYPIQSALNTDTV